MLLSCNGYRDGFCTVVLVTGMDSVLLSCLQRWFLYCCHGYRDGFCAVAMVTGMVSVRCHAMVTGMVSVLLS